MRLSPTEASRPTHNPWAQALLIALVVILAKIIGSLIPELRPLLSPVGAIVACGLVCVLAVMAVSYFCKWGWRSGILHGVALAVGLLTFIELQKTIETVLPEVVAIAAAGSTAVMASLIASGILNLILKPREA